METTTVSSLTPEQAQAIAAREAALVSIIEETLPSFAKMCRDPGAPTVVIQHQDAFAADYQDAEYLLLGMAVKFAGVYGKELHIIGKNGSTLGRV